MQRKTKDEKAILNKLGIEALNPMQQKAAETIHQNSEVILLSPTGTGKTVAFLLPLLAKLSPSLQAIQLLVLVPSRELAIQIEQVAREMGSGHKVNAVYGGRAGSKDRIDLKQQPSILIGTPGRIADHIRRGNVVTSKIETLVLDEFDKLLEVGFENEMREIVASLSSLKNKILTSATQKIEPPLFLNLSKPKLVNFLKDKIQKLDIKLVSSLSHQKLQTLAQLLLQTQEQNGIVFCNFKDSIQEVSDYLEEKEINHACFHGGLEQKDRERALIKFRNGTHRILVATDLAARGIDVPALDFIIHYELPPREEEFIHRNGRTARMQAAGTAFVLKVQNKSLPEFITTKEEFELEQHNKPSAPKWITLFISGGRKDKISKGDIAGLFFKQGGLGKNELGIIELKQDCAFVAVPLNKAQKLIEQLNNTRLKKKKVRISLVK